MSDDLNKKIKQITDILGQDTLPDNLKGLLNLLAAPGGRDETPTGRESGMKDSSSKDAQSVEDGRAYREERPSRNEQDDSMEMMHRIRKVMERVNTNNDPRVNLLTAIKPFLRSSRQKKLNNAIKFLSLSSLARLMDDNDRD